MIHVIDLNFLHIPQSIASFLIRSSIGPVLIETGPASTLASLEAGINQMGFDVKDVKHVFLTHIHLDHAGAAWFFAKNGANIYLHPSGVAHMNDPSKLVSSAKRIYKDEMDKLWGQMHPIAKEKLIPVHDGETINVGDMAIRAWHTPGHAIHHVAWQVNGSLFTGDVAGVKMGSGPVVPPCPPPDIDIEAWKHSIQIIRNLDIQNLFLTHYDKVDNIEDHLNELEVSLDDWSQWIRRRWMEGQASEEMVPAFQKYVIQQLSKFNLTEIQLKQYEAANPAGMSVAGLIRYWKKREEVK